MANVGNVNQGLQGKRFPASGPPRMPQYPELWLPGAQETPSNGTRALRSAAEDSILSHHTFRHFGESITVFHGEEVHTKVCQNCIVIYWVVLCFFHPNFIEKMSFKWVTESIVMWKYTTKLLNTNVRQSRSHPPNCPRGWCQCAWKNCPLKELFPQN